MSGPRGSFDGRALKANHSPSGEYDAPWPTTVTPDTIASAAAALGAGVPVAGGKLTAGHSAAVETPAPRLAGGALAGRWVAGDGLAGGSVAGDWVAGGSLVDGWLEAMVSPGCYWREPGSRELLWRASGSQRPALDSTSPGATATEPCSRCRRCGCRRGARARCRDRRRARPRRRARGRRRVRGRQRDDVTRPQPAASVPTTTAWFLCGDWMIDRGRAEIADGLRMLVTDRRAVRFLIVWSTPRQRGALL